MSHGSSSAQSLMLNRRKPHVTKAVADVVVGMAEGGGDNNTWLRRRGGAAAERLTSTDGSRNDREDKIKA
eukprot:CAMPEP_0181125898 /NCGR_PEP_ID=MMETSP1071-20121207/27314_1 /TAXON_ID=35127 /ORGANISM="Thalassiosira sp., Strain NH16" /LENGTH=69 /DNA_ID=CAMNT_0023211409 /DNA_START=20 /DNA_END=225 /DNA_ORIENTATION=+